MDDQKAAGNPEILDVVPDSVHKLMIVMPVPELFSQVGKFSHRALARQLGQEVAGAAVEILQKSGSLMCVGGWAPYAKFVSVARSIQWDIPRNNWEVLHMHCGMQGNDIGKQRNAGVEQALIEGCDYIWFQDYDVLNPPGAFGSLYSRNVDIVSGVYWMKTDPPTTMAMAGDSMTWFDNWWKMHDQEIKPGVKYRIGACYGGNGQLILVPSGCLVVKTEVFRKIEPPWFKQGSCFLEDNRGIDFTDDAYFCQKAREAGYELYLDTAVLCEHMDIHNGCVFGMEIIQDGQGKVKEGRPAWRFVTEKIWRPWTEEALEVIPDGDAYRTPQSAEDAVGGGDGEALADSDSG